MVDATIFGLGTLIAHQSTYLIKNLNGNDEVTISKKQPISIVASNSKNLTVIGNTFVNQLEDG